MTNRLRINLAIQLLTFGEIRKFMPDRQRVALFELLDSEEAEYFADIIIGLSDRIATMPKTYDTQDQEDPIVYLHYFGGTYDAWITEKDAGDVDELDPLQIQAFGWASFFGKSEAEAGYISIEELRTPCSLIELDFHWTPKPISEVLRED